MMMIDDDDDEVGKDSQSHSKRPLLRIIAGQRHPRNIESVRKSPEHLREYYAEVAGALAVE